MANDNMTTDRDEQERLLREKVDHAVFKHVAGSRAEHPVMPLRADSEG